MFISGTNTLHIKKWMYRATLLSELNTWYASPVLSGESLVNDSTWHQTQPNMAGTYLQSRARSADCFILNAADRMSFT